MFNIFKNYSEINYGLSQKSDGSMKLSNNKGENLYDIKNRKKYFTQFGISLNQIVSTKLDHSDNVKIVNNNDAVNLISEPDALITNTPELVLTITVADCFPVYFYNQKTKNIAIAHIGWKGTVLNIASKVIKSFIKNFNSKPEDILVYIGPGIQKHHFEVQENVVNTFKNNGYSDFITQNNSKIFIDLSGIIHYQLIKLSLLENNIEVSQECTYCENKYFSYRRDKPEIVEAMIGYIKITND